MNVPLAAGAVIVVSCHPGFLGALQNWTIRCDGKSWHGKELPDCTEVRCTFPLDPLGAWLGGGAYNTTSYLHCNDGYIPIGGRTSVKCTRPETPSASSLARCAPGGSAAGDAGAWRSGLRASGLWSFLGVAGAASALVLGCWREPGQGRREAAARAAALVGDDSPTTPGFGE
mmetsp:Transcript_4097/g.12452  ORF Transcript_4097/g.12452 Transcript_4097/m.12452 type:complete len:172 (+) Transcript_4097:1362-1877(+)